MLKEYPLEGVRTYDINVLPDERGFFAEAVRKDWGDFIPDEIAQANISFSYPGIIRAWHRHMRGQVDYFLVLKGASKICAYDDKKHSLVEIIGSGAKPTLIRVPGHYYHGFKAIADEPSLMIYFVNKIYDYKNPDEERISWDNNIIVPTEINGNKNDPRAGKPWDWFYPPYK